MVMIFYKYHIKILNMVPGVYLLFMYMMEREKGVGKKHTRPTLVLDA
jgi:hypothetical protein